MKNLMWTEMALLKKKPRGAIAIVVFNRASLTSKMLSSLSKCKDIEFHRVVVVQQSGNAEVEHVLREFNDLIEILVKVDGQSRNSTQNIAFNRMLANKIAFDTFKADYVLSLEDDAELSSDALVFTSEMYKKFQKYRKFVGVNLGSQIPFEKGNINSYSLLRFGVHSAHMLSRKTWETITRKRLIDPERGHFDGAIEHFLKTGFMVTPNSSRYIDNGANGTNTGADIEGSYFHNLRLSFVGNAHNVGGNYIENQLAHNWRRDCLPYQAHQNLRFQIQNLVWQHRTNILVRKLVRLFKRIEFD